MDCIHQTGATLHFFEEGKTGVIGIFMSASRNFWENKTGPYGRKPLAPGRIPGSWKGMMRDSCYMQVDRMPPVVP